MCVANRARSNLTQYCACKIYKLEIQRGDSRDVVVATRIYASMYKSIDKRESTGAISIHGPASVAFSTFNLVATIYHPEITLPLLCVTPRNRRVSRLVFFFSSTTFCRFYERTLYAHPTTDQFLCMHVQLHLRPNVCILYICLIK